MKHLFNNERKAARARRILRGARALIRSGEEKFVCCAVETAEIKKVGRDAYFSQPADSVCEIIHNEIQERIGFRFSVRDWLVDVHGIKDITSEQEREYRIRWIDSMLAELQ